MSSNSNLPILTNTWRDYLISLSKGVAGIIPFGGSFIAELIGMVQGQRLDRIAAFLESLNLKVTQLEQESLRERMLSEHFVDLFEDATRQAAQAFTKERRAYIASFLKNSLTNEQLDHIQEKKLLSLLAEVNDIEIIILQKHAYDRLFGTNVVNETTREFYDKYDHIIFSGTVSWDASAAANERAAFYVVYEENLKRLGLLGVTSSVPVVDLRQRGAGQSPIIQQVEVSAIGIRLLEYIDEMPADISDDPGI